MLFVWGLLAGFAAGLGVGILLMCLLQINRLNTKDDGGSKSHSVL